MPEGILTLLQRVRGSNAVVIHLDGEAVRTSSRQVVARVGLTEGATYDLAELEERLAAAEPEAAWARALASVARAETTQAKLRDKLLADGYPGHVAQAVVGALVARGYVDDTRYALIKARSLLKAGGRGRRGVEAVLTRSGISEETLATVLDETFPAEAELERAAQAADRLRSSARGSPERLARKLLSRGFEPETAWTAAKASIGAADTSRPHPPLTEERHGN